MKNRISIIILVFLTLMNIILPVIKAAEITKADLIYYHSINTHIKFYNAGKWYPIKCGYICYKIDGEKYPAYCIKHGVHGVDEEGDYTVTINDLLKDKLVYNTILNGYPYKTPEQLGVETIDDAYVATKHAVNTVLLNRDVYSFYKAADEQGEKIIDAIYEISEKGKSGNEINQDAKVNIVKNGDLTENGNYYYQEYKVTANRNISTYRINEISNFPVGTYICDINGSKKDSFNSNEKFKLMIPKKKMNENISGNIKVAAYCNTKPIFFGEAPRNDVQNYAVTYKPYAEYNSSTNFNIKTNTASIKIIKKDEESLEPIKDVEFGLYKKDNTLINKLKTNDDGEIIFSGLYQGEYIIKEEKANENYLNRNEVFNISTQYNKQIIKEITNKHKKGNLKITKVDKDDNNIALNDVEFDLIDSNNNIVRKIKTDSKGEAYVSDIKIGKYILRETKTKNEYCLCEDKEVKINWNETSNILIENEKKKGQVEIYKIDQEDKNVKISGVIFDLLDLNGKVVERLTTDSDGHAISKKIPIGEYYLKEIKTDNKYVLDNKIIKINIEHNKTLAKTIENTRKKATIKIIKKSSDYSYTLNRKKGDFLSETVFEIYNYNSELVDTIVTNENGEAESKELDIGRYKVKEKKSAKGYLLNNNEFLVNLTEDNQVKILNIENDPILPDVKIEKNGQKFAEKNEEIKYEFNITNNSNTSLDELCLKEILPYKQIKATKIVTGIYNEDINYKIYYKTEADEYILLKEVNALTSEYIDLDSISNENTITEIKIEYGKISKEFKSIINPMLYAKVNDNVKRDEYICNIAQLYGKIEGFEVEDKSIYTTQIKEKEIIKKLPKTGC